ncbi:drug metabolite transporter superfamily [Moniliophthora roreri]|nr:drug metabolite transporter superfamily [Moniliophthora roreri]
MDLAVKKANEVGPTISTSSGNADGLVFGEQILPQNPSRNATVLIFLVPFVTAISGSVILKETYTFKEATARGPILFGVILITRPAFPFPASRELSEDDISQEQRRLAAGDLHSDYRKKSVPCSRINFIRVDFNIMFTMGLQKETLGRGSIAVYAQLAFACIFEQIFQISESSSYWARHYTSLSMQAIHNPTNIFALTRRLQSKSLDHQ